MERKYIIPLRKEWMKGPRYLRTRKAVRATRSFLQKHMKTENIKLGKYLNLKLWENGTKNPPHKIEVIAKKIEDKDKGTYVVAEIPGAPVEVKKEVKKKGLAARLKSKIIEPETPAKELDKKPVGEMTKTEVATEEERLLEKEAKTAPKKKTPAKEVTKKENKESSQDIKATLNRSDKKR